MTLHAERLIFRRGARAVLAEASLTLNPGEFLGILGVNGAGKTTLLKHLAGLLQGHSGSVTFEGRPLDAVLPHERARQIAYLAQDADCAWPMTVEKVVTLGRLPHLSVMRAPGQKDRSAIETAMEETDVVGLRHAASNTLSGGERRRVALARALAGEPRYLLADEPVAALDPAHQLRTLELLRTKAEAGMGVIASLHDIPLAIRFCHRLALLHGGRIVCAGDWHAVCNEEHMASALGVTLAPVTIEGTPLVVPWRAVAPS